MPGFRRRGLAAPVHQAVDASSHNGWNWLIVRTATADTGNPRFYQQLFRCVASEPNAFTPAAGTRLIS
jgi:hypothetical protein